MCLAIPLKIIEKNQMEAIGEMRGLKKRIRIDLTPNVKIGDYVMVHAGFSIEVVDENIAKENIEAVLEVEKALKGE